MTPLFEELILKSELTQQEILELSKEDFQELVRLPKLDLDVIARTKLLREWKQHNSQATASLPPAPVTPTGSNVTRTSTTTTDAMGSGYAGDRKPAAASVPPPVTNDQHSVPHHPGMYLRQNGMTTSGWTNPDGGPENHSVAVVGLPESQTRNNVHESTGTRTNRESPAAATNNTLKRSHDEKDDTTRTSDDDGGTITSWWIHPKGIPENRSVAAARLPECSPTNEVNKRNNESARNQPSPATTTNAAKRSHKSLNDEERDTSSDPMEGLCQEEKDTNEPLSNNNANDTNAPLKQKKARVEIQETRKYGDRFLLRRAAKNGIMRLGGNMQCTFPKPSEQHQRLQDLGNFKVACYNDFWHTSAPQYAGQTVAAVRAVPDEKGPFAVFVRRSLTFKDKDANPDGLLLGWEYCGQYTKAHANDVDEMWTGASSISPKKKIQMAKTMLKYPQKFEIDNASLCAKVDEALATDASPAAPTYLVEGREPTDEERKQPKASLAARARALGYAADMKKEKLARVLVELDEFYSECGIQFVSYDEAIYSYVAAGITNKAPNGRAAANGNNTKASDWYAFFDQQVGY